MKNLIRATCVVSLLAAAAVGRFALRSSGEPGAIDVSVTGKNLSAASATMTAVQ